MQDAEFLETNRTQLHMEDNGDVIVGQYEGKPLRFLSTKRPRTLIYKKNDVAPIYFCDAVSDEPTKRELIIRNYIASDDRRRGLIYFSSTCLKGATAIRVFHVPTTNICRGLLLEYEGGARRALGECRLGVDPAQDFVGMKKLCFVNTKYQELGSTSAIDVVIVECHEHADHTHQDIGWTCCDMRGCVKVWFSGISNEMRIEYSGA